MTHYIIELLSWLAGFFFAGACIGCLLKRLFGADDDVAPAAALATSGMAMPVPAPVVIPPVAVAAPVAVAPRGPRMDRPRGIAMAREGKPDDLLRISGVGPRNEKILHSLGYFHFDQIAAWTPENVAWVDDHLKFNGRIDREEWINQARLLANGEETEFTRLYGSGGEGAKESGLRTVRGPMEKPAAAPIAQALVSPGVEDEEKPGTLKRPKGIAAARGGKADNLQRISGIGPKNEKVLQSLGFFHFDQIAAWTAAEVSWVDDHLKFNGRIKREEWIRQARLLAEGREEEFTRLYGTGGLKNRKGETMSGSRTRKT
jgi:predicted flap endonuclease-1-like 5' DNA nuclease